MKFFLTKDHPFESVENGFDINKRYSRSGRFEIGYQVEEETCNEHERRISSVLKRMLESYEINRDIVVSLRFDQGESSGLIMIYLQLFEEGSFLKDISTLFGRDNVRVYVTLSNLPTDFQWSRRATKGMTVLDNGKITCQCSLVELKQAYSLSLFLYAGRKLSCEITAKVVVNTKSHFEQSVKLPMYKKMLHDEIHTDLVINAYDGNPIKCHKAVLSASSEVFETMFRNDMEESIIDEIIIPDMTEDGVRSLLAYIYYSDEDGPNKDSGVALQVLKAVHKYNVTQGNSTMKDILLTKPEEWYNLDVAVRLFLYARQLPTGDQLKMKAVNVLKKNCQILQQSEAYKEMFCNDPEAAMELYQLSVAL